MTVKLVVLYTHPDDANAFDEDYAGTHIPLVDNAALQAGFGSDEGKATAADCQKIAPAGSRMFVVPVDD